MGRFRIAATVLFATMSVCACQRPKSQTEAAVNGTPTWPKGQGWKIAETPSTVIGEAEGSPEYQFNYVAAARVVADTLIVVGDQWMGQIHFYTRRGAHVRTVGRNGNGPGEYRNIAWIGTRGDSLVVWDPFTARVTVLNPDGSLARTVRVPKAGAGLYLAAGLLGDGSLLLREPDDRRGPNGEQVDSISYARVSTSTGAMLSRLGPFLLGERFTAGDHWTTIITWVIFGRRGIVFGTPQGIFVGATDRFELTLSTIDGRPLRRFERAWNPTLADDEDVSAVIQYQRAALESTERPPDIVRLQEEMYPHIPHRDTLPAFTRALADDGGNVWMEEFRIDPDAAGTWSVFDPAGRWLGQVQMPAGVQVMSIGRDAMVGVTKDELDVQRVVVYPLLR